MSELFGFATFSPDGQFLKWPTLSRAKLLFSAFVFYLLCWSTDQLVQCIGHHCAHAIQS